ncbi:hypothetical protein I4U23_019841 [Adineta vaga]|nr:hypothetical protein I4U23_019841 [Adineta vaga]
MVYSTISDIQSCTSLQEICRYIQQNKNSTVDRPVSYILRPINWLYPSYRETGTKFTVPLSELNRKIEEHLFYIKANIAKMETSLKEEIPKLSCGYLRNYIDNFRKQVSNVKVKYTSMIQQLYKLLVNVRSGRISMSKLEEELKNNEQISVKNLCTDLIRQLDGLKSKVNFITELDQLKFVYVDVCERGIDSADKERTMQQKLIQTGNTDRIICSTDALNKKYAKQFKKHRENLVEEYRNNPNKRLIYADFSYSSYDLREIIVLPLNQEQNENKSGQQTTSISSREILNLKPVDTKKQTVIQETRTFASFETTGTFISPLRKSESNTSLCQSSVKLTDHEELSNKASHRTSPTAVLQSIRSSSIQSKDHDTITILLIGETGVGKSSFINAFANYLRFHTLDNAQSNQPLVLIPVSFIITVGDTFVERTVKFGDVNDSKNEDFNHPGQSVTQRCKSYEFEYQINGTVGKKIRIIDTPGFGDTRGIEQDDRNMKEIFNYAKTLSHVNAVCVLLKPNETRLNIFFRSCLTQLFTVLGPNISNNISFCFTNSRSTFYTPGNTGPLLKKMLASLSMGNTLFKKENTFCFDSESFRYLVARKNNITFSADQKKEYDMSWTISRKEANRLIHYICNNLTTYRL